MSRRGRPGPADGLRVLTLTESTTRTGGRGIAQLDTCAGLVRRGHQVAVLRVEAGDAEAEWAVVAQRLAMPPRGLKLLRSHPLGTSGGVATTVWRGVRWRPDVVYVHARLLVFAAAAIGRAAGAPVVAHLHDPVRPPDRQDRWAARQVDRWLAVSSFQAAAWTEVGVPAERVEVIRNGVDLDRFRPPTDDERRAARSAVGLPADGLAVAVVGRIDEQKGQDVAAAAVEALVAGGRPAVLVVAGPGEVSDWPAPTIALGPVDDPRDVYWAADVVVVPSRGHDSFPLVPVEAMACGRVVVGTEAGGIPEAVGAVDPGLVVPVDDPGALARAVKAAVADGRRRSLEARSRAVAEERFDAGAALARVEAALGDVVGR